MWFKIKIKLFCLLVIGPSLTFAASPKKNNFWKITQYVDPKSSDQSVLVSAGSEQGVFDGNILLTYRKVGHKKIFTGQLKVEDVKDHYSVAKVVENGSVYSQAMFPKFPGVMAGDHVEMQLASVEKNKVITPILTVKYSKLFLDPKSAPYSYELTAMGRDLIRDQMRPFLKAHLPKIMIEGHTDQKGSAQENQTESYQRALTIKQFIIDELGFDDEQIIAVGLGEGDIIDHSYASGYEDNNRRIVIKALPDVK